VAYSLATTFGANHYQIVYTTLPE